MSAQVGWQSDPLCDQTFVYVRICLAATIVHLPGNKLKASCYKEGQAPTGCEKQHYWEEGKESQHEDVSRKTKQWDCLQIFFFSVDVIIHMTTIVCVMFITMY